MYKESPYKKIPNELYNGYTMEGVIPVLDWWRDDSANNKPIVWDKHYIEDFLKRYTVDNVKNGRNGWSPYGNTHVKNLLHSFQKYGITKKNVAVIGSLDPWIESMLYNLQNTVTTVEYNVPLCDSDKITCIDYFKDFHNTKDKYDCIVTFSSIEHSGLGRYGDPLDPDGDIKTMEDIYKNLKKGGTLIWGAPVGIDALVWNVHRVYGKHRLPVLFKNFDEIEWIGHTKEELFSKPLGNNGEHPVIVLTCKD